MVHLIRFPFINPQLGRELEPGRHFYPHYPLSELGIRLLYQRIHNKCCLDTSVNAISSGVQILELLLGCHVVVTLVGMVILVK